jgi:hypothetical protein
MRISHLYDVEISLMQPNNSSEFPSDLDTFIGKQMLFKVEVTDGNLLHNWRNYAVKRTTADVEIIQRFMTLHNIKGIEYEVDTDVPSHLLAIGGSVPPEVNKFFNDTHF